MDYKDACRERAGDKERIQTISWRVTKRCWFRRAAGFLFCTFCVFTSGCSTFQAAMQPTEYEWSRGVHAAKARLAAGRVWRQKYADCYAKSANYHDLRHGFIDGFVERSLGGDGCEPVLPPMRYLGCKTGLSNRSCAIDAWYSTYPLGAAAAESCGYADWWQLHIPPHIRQRCAPPVCNAPCSAQQVPACECGTCNQCLSAIGRSEEGNLYHSSTSDEGSLPLNVADQLIDSDLLVETNREAAELQSPALRLAPNSSPIIPAAAPVISDNDSLINVIPQTPLPF